MLLCWVLPRINPSSNLTIFSQVTENGVDARYECAGSLSQANAHWKIYVEDLDSLCLHGICQVSPLTGIFKTNCLPTQNTIYDNFTITYWFSNYHTTISCLHSGDTVGSSQQTSQCLHFTINMMLDDLVGNGGEAGSS